jgi:tRNA-splicing ligase RtcB
MKYYTEGRVPAKMWLNEIEDSAMAQVKNLCNLPFAYKHIAIMPDSHMGYGMPIGGVLAAENVLVPNAVGVDIGCGMIAVNLNIPAPPVHIIKEIMGHIRQRIPVGFNSRDTALGYEIDLPDGYSHIRAQFGLDSQKTRCQMGTLGGGNHFIELQQDENGSLWVMIHSGSRNLGKRVCEHYNKLAMELNAKWHVSVPHEHELAFLPLGTEEGHEYRSLMWYCIDWAKMNREKMLDQVLRVFTEDRGVDIFPGYPIDTKHNYAADECHSGTIVQVHRKGAVRAQKDEIVIIPGSQGTKSYIARGLGNPHSFESCSHGAGRRMSRSAASKTLDLQQQVKIMDDKGIVHGIRTEKDLDEAPGAYKDIDEVMENQKDLVEIVHTLTPLGVIKG